MSILLWMLSAPLARSFLNVNPRTSEEEHPGILIGRVVENRPTSLIVSTLYSWVPRHEVSKFSGHA